MTPRVDADADAEATHDVDVALNARAPNPAWTKAPWASISTSNRPRSTRGFERRPPRASDADDEDAESESESESADDSASATASEDVETRHWRECFRRARDVDVGTRGTFRVYSNDASSSPSTTSRTPEGAPVCFLLHGCPYTALTGGGVAEEFARRAAENASSVAAAVDVVAMDLRGHGESRGWGARSESQDTSASTFDPDVMARDAFETLREFLQLGDGGVKRRVVVVGHSMGGAVATRVATLLETSDESTSTMTLAGLVLIDIVEGSALRALPAMGAMADARPTAFSSLRDAMRWNATRGGGTTNPRSAALSLPSQLRREDAEDGRRRYVWRTDVRATAPFWRAWYEGLSRKFLAVRAAKLLILAGNDRLDTELTVAQMQGKFQLALLPKTGHAVHEDSPEETATAIENFFARYVVNARPTPPPFVV